jgi:Uma2 family endonuclease
MPRETYDRILEEGILGPDDKIELLEGRLVVAEPKHSPHATAMLLVAEALRKVLTHGWHVRTELPLALGTFSEPEPDVSVVRGEILDYRHRHPTHAALVVEVADSSLRLDRTIKKRIYAAAGIADYWIVDIRARMLEVYREPFEVAHGEHDYRAVISYSPGQSVSPLALPDVSIAVADLLVP